MKMSLPSVPSTDGCRPCTEAAQSHLKLILVAKVRFVNKKNKTLDRYSHMVIGDERAALDCLPILIPADPDRQKRAIANTRNHPLLLGPV